MKILLATLVLALYAIPAEAQFTFKKVETRTAFGAANQGNKGKLVIEGKQIRFTKNDGKSEYFSIPADAVSEIFYSRVSGRRIGAAIAVSPFLLFSKGRKHYMTLAFNDGRNLAGAVEFKLHKSNYRGVLRTVEQVTGLAMKYDQEGVKDTKQTVASRGEAGASESILKITSDPEGAEIEAANAKKPSKTTVRGKMSISAKLEAEGSLQEPAPAQESMSKNDVQAAIDSGKAKAKKKKCKDIGLELFDRSGHTFHSIWIYTPRAWVEQQSCQAARNNRDVSLTEGDVQPVLRVSVAPWSVPKEARSTPSGSPCPSLRTVVLKDESQKSVLRPKSEEKQTVRKRSKYDWGTFSCVAILATFSLSEVAALRALSPDAEFLVTVAVDVAGVPRERIWKVKVKHFKKLP